MYPGGLGGPCCWFFLCPILCCGPEWARNPCAFYILLLLVFAFGQGLGYLVYDDLACQTVCISATDDDATSAALVPQQHPVPTVPACVLECADRWVPVLFSAAWALLVLLGGWWCALGSDEQLELLGKRLAYRQVDTEEGEVGSEPSFREPV